MQCGFGDNNSGKSYNKIGKVKCSCCAGALYILIFVNHDLLF